MSTILCKCIVSFLSLIHPLIQFSQYCIVDMVASDDNSSSDLYQNIQIGRLADAVRETLKLYVKDSEQLKKPTEWESIFIRILSFMDISGENTNVPLPYK